MAIHCPLPRISYPSADHSAFALFFMSLVITDQHVSVAGLSQASAHFLKQPINLKVMCPSSGNRLERHIPSWV